jgi:hypothetical protein
MNAIPEHWLEQVRSGRLSGPPPHDPIDWLGDEVDQIAADLGLRFEQSDNLAVALAAAFESMSNEELSARYRAIKTGLAAWGISGHYIDGGLICEWAGYPLLVVDLDVL